MSWVAVAIGGSALLTTGSQTGWKFGFGGGKGDGMEIPTYNLPDFQEDPYAGMAQEALYPLGAGLLKGNVPDYYKPIGEIGGELFEGVLGLGKKDITTAITEDFARKNIRGVRSAPVIGGAVGEFSKKARWDDYLRALTGRQFLLGAGADIMAGVGQRGLTTQGQQNQYEVSKGNLALGYAGLQSDIATGAATAKGEAIGSTISGLSNLYANYRLGQVNPTSYADPVGTYDVGYGSGYYPGGYA